MNFQIFSLCLVAVTTGTSIYCRERLEYKADGVPIKSGKQRNHGAQQINRGALM